jgi:hypothetical protein
LSPGHGSWRVLLCGVLSWLAGIAGGFLPPSPAWATVPSPPSNVSPRLHDVFLPGGLANAYTVRVDLGHAPPSHEPLEVLFLFDRTASMGNVIGRVREQATEIMGDIRQMSTASTFAVAALWDYDYEDGPPWRLYQDFAEDVAAVGSAIGSITVRESGKSTQEAYSRALFEAASLGWRPDARHFVILFGDAPAHDPDFYGKDLGVDRGRDGVAGTADDLRLRDVVHMLADRHIAVLAVYDERTPKALLAEAITGFKYMAEQTHGVAKPIRKAQDVRAAIRAGMREGYVPRPALWAPDSFATWVRVGPPRKVSGIRYDFRVRLMTPRGTKPGMYAFPLTATYADSAERSEIGQSQVVVRVGLRYLRWRRLLVPLYLLFLLLLLLRSLARTVLGRIPPRYAANRQWVGLLWRAGLVVLLLVGLYLIWHWDPNRPPVI